MKTIKTLFSILFLTTMFIACETDSINEEVGIEGNIIEIEDVDVFGNEDDDGIPVTPPKPGEKE